MAIFDNLQMHQALFPRLSKRSGEICKLMLAQVVSCVLYHVSLEPTSLALKPRKVAAVSVQEMFRLEEHRCLVMDRETVVRTCKISAI